MSCRFFYFDLGNVLLTFDNQIACRNLANLTGLPMDTLHSALFESGLEQQYESGQISSEDFCRIFCERTGADVPADALMHAASDMFSINVPIVPIVAQLRAVGHPLGIISNTCDAHWQFLSGGRYTMLTKYFDQFVLSFEVGIMKPDPRIFQVAVERAGCRPGEIFYVDDRIENVEAARRAGLDATLFRSAQQLVQDLAQRQVPVNL